MKNILLAALVFKYLFSCALLLWQVDLTMFSNIRSPSQSCRLLTFTSPSVRKKPLLKTLTLLPKPLRKSVTLDKSNHRLIYCFPYITFIGGFLKSKISIPVASVTVAPALYFLDETHASPYIAVLGGIVYFSTGTLISKFSANVVGKIYVNKEDVITEVIMSSVDETGRRIDRIHKLQDLINIDYPSKVSRALGFTAIGIENSNVYYKVNKRNCQFIDESACDYVFGFAWSNIIQETSESEKETQKEEDINKTLPEK